MTAGKCNAASHQTVTWIRIDGERNRNADGILQKQKYPGHQHQYEQRFTARGQGPQTCGQAHCTEKHQQQEIAHAHVELKLYMRKAVDQGNPRRE